MDPVTALTTCRTYEAACDAAGSEAVERAIRSMHWAIMAAPDIYLLVSEWMQVQRIDDAERDLIDSRVRVMHGLRDLDTDPDGPADDKKLPKPPSTMGPDLLSVRASTVTKSIEAHVKLATGRMKLHESLMRRIQHVIWRIGEIGKRPATPAQIRAQVMGYIANTDPKLDAAIAFARVWTPPTHTTWRNDGEIMTRIDARTGEPLEDGVQHALPALTSELEQLRAARDRALAAGDFSDVVKLGAEIRTVESEIKPAQIDATDAELEAELEALRAAQ